MKITFLGTSHGAPELGRYCTSVLAEHEGFNYIIDLGAPVEYLMKNSGVSANTVKGIFITHMHADHADAIASVTKSFAVYNKEAEADLFLPEKEAVEPYKAWMAALHINIPERLGINVTEEGKIYEKHGLRVTAIRTEHIAKDIPTFSYMFEAEGKRVLFTGDLAYDFHDFPAITKKEDFDLVVSELTHFAADKAYNIMKDIRTKQIIFSHVTPYNVNLLHEKNIKFDFPHVVAFDGMSVEV